MLEQQEKLWDYSAVAPGQSGNDTVVQITLQNIEQYSLIAQNRDPRISRLGDNVDCGAALMAMPTMVLTYAPLLRDDIAEANGFVALEQSLTARRQTPFAKCEIRWSGAVRAGDTITSNRYVLEKYERRGSKFVTFRVESVNQHRQRVAEYDYTCIFEYAQGQRQVPQDRGAENPTISADAGANLPGGAPRLLTFGNVSVGDQLPSLAISESQEIINAKSDFRLAGKPSISNIHTDEEFARQNIFGGTVNSGPATLSYVDQMLQQSFPLQAFYEGGRLLMRAITPFRAGDTVTFQGEITNKQQKQRFQGEGDMGFVECRVKGVNQRGELVSLSDATVVLPV